MSLKLWTTDINKIYLWSTEIKKAYLGATLVYDKTAVANWLLNNLVSYYKMDTNGSFPDAHWSNDGTINGATFTASWKINGGYDFDRINDFINISSTQLATLLNGRNPFSISIWVKLDTLTAWQIILDTRWSDFNWFFIELDSNSKLKAVRSDWAVADTIAICDNVATTWTFCNLVITYDWTNGKMYRDSVEQTWWTSTRTLNSNWDFKIGKWFAGNSSFWYFGWTLDENWYWSKILNQTDVDNIYNSWPWLSYDKFNAEIPVTSNWLLNNLVSYYKMDTNGSFPDVHGSNNGTINGATFTASGKINWGYSFDWSNDSIALSQNSSTILDNDFSISIWFNINNSASSQWFLYKFWLRDIWIRWGNVTDNIQFQLFDWTTNAYLNTPVNKNEWVHWVFVRDKSSWMKIYINGVEQVSNNFTWNGSTISITEQIWRIATSQYYYWLLDELAFYSRVLTQTDVTNLYNSWAWKPYDEFTT